ncbi:MAG: hypothetical protein AAGD25_23190 [Cyanobacteria bacterium P01_F01_bin.150]
MTLFSPLTASLRPLPAPSLRQQEVVFCLILSLLAPLYFGLISWHYVASAPVTQPIIQDDARLHISWLQRLMDPALFPNDIAADYYAATQSVGFKAIYGLAAAFGLEPLMVAQGLPVILALVTTIYLFWVSLRLLPIPLCGVLTTLILNQNIWLKDDLISATPRAFVYPLFAAFLYYLLERATLSWLIILVLQGLFYPQMMMVSAGILALRLVQWRGILPKRFAAYQEWPFAEAMAMLVALGLAVAMLLFFSHQVEAQLGPVISAEEMRQMPEFQVNGRRQYFGVSPLQFWFGGASGLRLPLFPPIILLGTLLPVAIIKKFSLAPNLTAQTRILPELLLSALGLFLLAHLLFPKLYLPSRYTFYSLRFLMAIATGLMLTLVLDWSRRWLHQRQQWQWGDGVKVTVGVGVAIAILTVPAIPPLFLSCQGWIVGETPRIYQYLAQTPKDTLVASLDPDASNIPTFAQRSVWVSGEFALPYHADFYQTMLERMEVLVKAQYSTDMEEVRSFVQASGIDQWIVHQTFTDPDYLMEQSWLINSSIQSTVAAIAKQLHKGQEPALLSIIPSCTVLEDNRRLLLDAYCLKAQ